MHSSRIVLPIFPQTSTSSTIAVAIQIYRVPKETSTLSNTRVKVEQKIADTHNFQKRGQPPEDYPNIQTFSWKFPFHLIFILEFPEFSGEWPVEWSVALVPTF